MLSFRSLRVRIAVIMALLVALVLTLMVVLVSVANLRVFYQQGADELQRGEYIFRNLLAQHDQQMTQAAQLLAADFGFRSALASRDAPTIMSALDNQRERIGASLALLSDLDGQLIVDDGVPRVYPFPKLLADARRDGQASGIRLFDGQAYRVVIVPVRAPLTIGWVSMGMPVDDQMAAEFQRLSGLEVSFMLMGSAAQGKVLSSTLPTLVRQALATVNPRDERLHLAGQPYQSRLLVLDQNPTNAEHVDVLLQRSMADILAPFYVLLQAMLVLAVLSLIVVALVSVRIAGVVTRPLHRMVLVAQRIQAGQYAQQIESLDTIEMAELGSALTHMQSAIAAREDRILNLLYRDGLTGLHNRAGFIDVLEQRLISKAAQTVVLVNIDRFQQINDTLGHPFGDEVLVAFAHQLERVMVGHTIEVGRLSGDEFAILIEGSADWAGLIDRLVAHFEQPLQVMDRSLDVRATIGYAHYPQHSDRAVGLICCADEAMYIAKEKRLRHLVYDPHRQQFQEAHLSLLGELKHAVEHDELMLYYQPKVQLSTGQVHEAEALIRWQHPDRGFIPPNAFIPFAEQTGYIRDLTRWVIRRGCLDAAKMAAVGQQIRVSVNVATRDLQDAQLPVYIAQCLHEAQLSPTQLCLEITESGVMEESAVVMAHLIQLKDMGVSLSIDDYGTGYSSLAYVRQLPISELKIDQSFVRGVAAHNTDAMIVRSTIELAHSLGFKVVAEGVETEEISQVLTHLGCDVAQGYLYAKPLALPEFLAWLQARIAQ